MNLTWTQRILEFPVRAAAVDDFLSDLRARGTGDLNAVLTTEPLHATKLNAHVSRDLDIVIRTALEKERKDRYASAGALADDLENVLHFRPIRARPTTAARRTLKWIRRKPMHAALIGLIAVTLPTVAFLTERALESRRLARASEIAQPAVPRTSVRRGTCFSTTSSPAKKKRKTRPRFARNVM